MLSVLPMLATDVLQSVDRSVPKMQTALRGFLTLADVSSDAMMTVVSVPTVLSWGKFARRTQSVWAEIASTVFVALPAAVGLVNLVCRMRPVSRMERVLLSWEGRILLQNALKNPGRHVALPVTVMVLVLVRSIPRVPSVWGRTATVMIT